MTRTILALLIFLLPLNAFASDGKEKLRLGFIAPLSGQAKVYGEVAKNGLELALAEVGRDWIDVIYEDDQFKPAKSVAAFRKLVEIDKVDAVICIASTPCNAVAPLAQNRKIPLFAWASDEKVSRGRSYVVRTYPSAIEEGRSVAEEALKKDYDKIAVVTTINDFATPWGEGVKQVLGEKVVFFDEVPGDAKDFNSIILRMRSRQALQSAICLDPGQSAAFAKQAHVLMPHLGIFGCENLHDKAEIAAAGGSLDYAWFVTIAVKDSFRRKYSEKYGSDSLISGAAIHYDLSLSLYDWFKEERTIENLLPNLSTLKSRSAAINNFIFSVLKDDQFLDLEYHVQAAKQ